MNLELRMAEPIGTYDTEILAAPSRPPQIRLGVLGAAMRHHLTQAFGLVALAFLCYFTISRFLVQSVQVVGVSMEPTLGDTQHYLLNRWVYYLRSPQPTDVVVLRDPSDNGFSVKRIIAAEGDSVYLQGGWVFINGHKLAEPYLPARTPTFAFGKFKDQLIMCGKGQYFVLGDNRMNSCDSRTYGPIPRQNILGMIVR